MLESIGDRLSLAILKLRGFRSRQIPTSRSGSTCAPTGGCYSMAPTGSHQSCGGMRTGSPARRNRAPAGTQHRTRACAFHPFSACG